MKTIEYLIKHNKIVQLLYRVIFSSLFSFISWLTPIKKNLVLISSFSGKKYNDSPKTLYESMVKKGLLKKYEVVWAFDNPKHFANEGLNTVKINSFKYFYTAFRAKYWITNVNIERGLQFKKKKQIYLNTWHGTGPKTSGNAATGRKDYNFKKVNYLCADGEYLKGIFVNYFNAKPENVLLCGRPREDVLYNPDKTIEKNIREKYNLSENDFVILYAPTWREANRKEKQSVFNVTLDIKNIFNKIPNAKVLFRAHSITSSVYLNENYGNRFISITEEPEINDFYLVSDVLITDYSSSPTDISILKKPFICFAPDYNDYVKERGLFFNIKKEYPFGVQTTTEEVLEVLQRIINGEKKTDEIVAFKQKYGPYGGDATNICLDKLFGLNGEDNI